MAAQEKPSKVQRAYTLRLNGVAKDDSWRDSLWRTHEAVNKGAKVFGDWILTLRGGLDHTLVDAKVKGGKGKPDRDPTDEERANRRILLALSWLSVESSRGAPANFIIARGSEKADERDKNVCAAFKEILRNRGLEAEDTMWRGDCAASLSAAIRDDAVWVNRSAMFDCAVEKIGSSLSREEIWDLLDRFFGNCSTYLQPVKLSEDDSSDSKQDDKAKNLIEGAGQWLSSRFGTGKGADFRRMAAVYEKIAEWADKASAGATGKATIKDLAVYLKEFKPPSEDLQGALKLISGSGYKSKTRNLLKELEPKATVTDQDLGGLKEEATNDAQKCRQNTGAKGQRLYADAILKDAEKACGFTYLDTGGAARHKEFAVMLDHAARRVSLAHTWIKRAEAARRQFEDDLKKSTALSDKAREWLDTFCEGRSESSGALEPYRIRPRALAGWKEVVAAWRALAADATVEDRIRAARELQDNPEIDKFGDIQLFEALAEDDALCVWRKGGDAGKDPDPQSLIDYARASEAEYKKRHFKVPAYRHPDALLHPVFCDFGTSRWNIDFSIHEAAKAKEKALAKVEKARNACEKARAALEKAELKGKDTSAPKKKLDAAKKKLDEAEEEVNRLSSKNRMRMTLWDGKTVAPKNFEWRSKRLFADLALGQNEEESATADPTEVSRADRFGRAVANVGKSAGVRIAGLFEEEKWPARLQAPRRQLEAISALEANCKLSKEERRGRIARMKNHIRWLVTFSPKLQPCGPWVEFAKTNGLKVDPKYYPHADANKNRGDRAKLILSRLPGLRLLSVDLGHRHAAACAVWEAMAEGDFEKERSNAEKKSAEIHYGPDGCAPKNAIYAHLVWPEKASNSATKKAKTEGRDKFHPVTIYRRIGADTLPDGAQHPAPWARLDRQFLIKIQGEEEGARAASNEEIWKVHQMEAELGRTEPIIDRLVKAGWGQSDKQKARLAALRELGWKPSADAGAEGSDQTGEAEFRRRSLAVDDLIFSAVNLMRFGLKRHGDRARIAHYLIAEEKSAAGGAKKQLDENGRIALLRDALIMWRDLFSSRGWRDDAAKKLWDGHIAKLPGCDAMNEVDGARSGGGARKAARAKAVPAAMALRKDESLCRRLHESWKSRWEEDDKEWLERLRCLKDSILPRGKAATSPSIRKMGGLSTTRIGAMTEFRRRVQVAFFTRLHPDGSKTETNEGFGQSALDALEQLREQRVKQLASRIVEAALGVGRMKRSKRGGKLPERPTERVDKPCHAVVIENLKHYRPEESRTRRANRQLMNWSSSKVKKHLGEGCELHGLHLREVSPAYTSRQDSRSGAPGIRCQDVSVKEFMGSPFWRKEVKLAKKKTDKGKGCARDEFLCDLNKKLQGAGHVGTIRIPLKGGEIFVSADSESPASKGAQADLNAAANIGLRALTDPDWPGKWWYVPSDATSFKPTAAKVKGSAAVEAGNALKDPPSADESQSGDEENKKGKSRKKSATKKGTKAGSKTIVNLWRDVSSGKISKDGPQWESHNDYWNGVEKRVIDILRASDCAKDGHPKG